MKAMAIVHASIGYYLYQNLLGIFSYLESIYKTK